MQRFHHHRCAFLLLCLALTNVFPARPQEKLRPVFPFHRLVVNGLSDEIRSHIVRDNQGFVWIGTLNGLARYDGYSIKTYRNDPDDPYSLSSNIIKDILIDKYGRMWVGTHTTGLHLYDPAHDRFISFLSRPRDSSWNAQKSTYALSEDRAGNIWIATNYGGAVRVELPPGMINSPDTVSQRIKFTTYMLGTPSNCASNVLECRDGRTMVGSDSGVILINPATHAISRLGLPGTIARRLEFLTVNCMMQDSLGNIWVGTDTEGLFRIDGNTNEVRNYRRKKGDVLTIRSDRIFDIAQDHRGNLWIGSDGGVDYFSPTKNQCVPYLTAGSAPHWPSSWVKLSLDREGVLWFGTMDGGVHWLSAKAQLFPLYALAEEKSATPVPMKAINRDSTGMLWFLSSWGKLYNIDVNRGIVRKSIDILNGKQPFYGDWDSFIDAHGVYWYGTWGLGLFRVDLRTGHVSNFSAEAGLSSNRTVNGIAQGEGDTLWVTTYSLTGLMKFSESSGKFIVLPSSFPKDDFRVMRDQNGFLWVSSELRGVTIVNPATGVTELLTNNPSDPRSLSNDHVRFLLEDASGRVWVGAGNVINLWDPASHSFTRYVNAGFKNSLFADPLASDDRGRLWVRYEGDGLSVFDPSTGSFTNFDNDVGINQGNSMQALNDGRLLLAQWNGVNIFHPDSIDIHRPGPPIVISRLSINDKPVVPPVLDGNFNFMKLSYSENTIEFEFAAIDIDAPHLVEYTYRLEGLENDWVTPQDRRFVRYPGLTPGGYTFRLRAASLRGEWPVKEIALSIDIAPPWWRTWWAYGLYTVLLAGFASSAYRLRVRQLSLRQRAEHLAEVDRIKSRFFANISHEFRTPLTLILGPIERIRSEVQTDSVQKSLTLMQRSAHSLLRLVNQLLDLSKLEAGAMKLRASCINIVPLVRGLAYSFESSAGLRRITLNVDSEDEEIEVYCDRDMVEKILTNLLSNALKFTAEGGAVEVRVSVEPSRPPSHSPTLPLSEHREGVRGRGGEYVMISVVDTGAGIAPEHLSRIFDRFYQVDESQTREHEGTGIGLALVKELVELHHGTIDVKSEIGKGTEFTVRLPLGRAHLKDEEIVAAPAVSEPSGDKVPDVSAQAREEDHEEGESTTPPDARPIVLVVEDNADVRDYMKSYLDTHYQVVEARDGAAGIEKALETVPDLVISDVMMPKKDGYEVCRTLKLDEKTSHVPIILLTAKAASENRIEGLETGADDYLVKPFESKELLARVKNLIDLRRKLRERFSAGQVLKPGEITVSSIDDVFLQKVKSIVEAHMSEEGFGPEELSREVAMSRSQVHRKLIAVTGIATGDFIRYLRLHRAMDLLRQNAATVAEIAYMVGFSTPSHFTKCFRDLFGTTPAEVRRTVK